MRKNDFTFSLDSPPACLLWSDLIINSRHQHQYLWSSDADYMIINPPLNQGLNDSNVRKNDFTFSLDSPAWWEQTNMSGPSIGLDHQFTAPSDVDFQMQIMNCLSQLALCFHVLPQIFFKRKYISTLIKWEPQPLESGQICLGQYGSWSSIHCTIKCWFNDHQMQIRLSAWAGWLCVFICFLRFPFRANTFPHWWERTNLSGPSIGLDHQFTAPSDVDYQMQIMNCLSRLALCFHVLPPIPF